MFFNYENMLFNWYKILIIDAQDPNRNTRLLISYLALITISEL